MQTLVVIGAQWGDEGKGKIVDCLSPYFDIVARFQGGNNAGHTINVNGAEYKLRLIPAGVLHNKKLIIGNGVAFEPSILILEMAYLKNLGFDVDLLISDRAHVITPYDILLDGAQEDAKGVNKIGTTMSGIGPVYAHKMAREGLRTIDFFNDDIAKKWNKLADTSSCILQDVYHVMPVSSSDFEKYIDMMNRLQPYVGDCGQYLTYELDAGRKILFEGAQGTLLDIDHGTYPYCTSSNCVSAQAATGTGISYKKLKYVLGVSKAYTTRVGAGPFPTELKDTLGDKIRTRGKEFGTVTNRPRRCGWLDLIALQYANRLNGFDGLAITKLDVLTDIDPIKVCIGYKIKKVVYESFPADEETLNSIEPVYKEMSGWNSLNSIELDEYVRFISSYLKLPVVIRSFGADRKDTTMVPAFEQELNR
jgi:adenylosuccinate synthase